MRTDDALNEIIHSKLLSGALPKDRPIGTWGGHGDGRPCSGCERPVLETEVERELEFVDGQTIRFHLPCEVTWRQATAQ